MVGNEKVDITKPHPSIAAEATKPPRSKSVYWDGFHCTPDAMQTAVCNRCGTKVPCGGQAGTNGMRKHLLNKHPAIHNLIAPEAPITAAYKQSKRLEEEEAKVPSVNTRLEQLGVSSQRITGDRREMARQKALCAVTMYLVTNDRPYSDVSDSRFRAMIAACVEAAKTPGVSYNNFTPENVKDQCKLMADITRDHLMERIKGKRLSATFDHWTSRANQNYSCLTLHWIENFELQSIVMSVYVYKGEARAKNIYTDYLNKLKEFGVEPFVKHAVTDTAAAMNLVGIAMEEDDREHVYCSDHVLQLVAKEAFDANILGETAYKEAKAKADALKVQAESDATGC